MIDRTVLVVAAYSDYEALGCAGTIAKHVASGDEVHLIFMADGVGSRLDTDNRMDDVSLLDVVSE